MGKKVKTLPENYFFEQLDDYIWTLLVASENHQVFYPTGIKVKCENIEEAVLIANEYIPFFEKKWKENGNIRNDDVVFTPKTYGLPINKKYFLSEEFYLSFNTKRCFELIEKIDEIYTATTKMFLCVENEEEAILMSKDIIKRLKSNSGELYIDKYDFSSNYKRTSITVKKTEDK